MIKVTKAGREITSGKCFAYFDNGQFEVSHDEMLRINFKIQCGETYEVTREWFDAFDGVKYEY